MRTTVFISLILIFCTNFNYSQTKEVWFPTKLNIQPFTANLLEARAGFSSLINQSRVRLDIGTSHDIFRLENNNSVLSFGADMFTFTRLRNEAHFKFPVETIDYFFGINSGYKITDGCTQYGFRFRLSHISAHIVDGRFDAQHYSWRGGLLPFVYSREFVELFPFYQIGSLRGYAGFTYLFHIIPTDFGREIYQVGFDYYYIEFPVKNITPFIADDFKITQIGKYFGNNIFTAGLKFGHYNGYGFSILFSHYSGKSIHGEYYDNNENYSSIGINLDL